jgi:hypothetical protein
MADVKSPLLSYLNGELMLVVGLLAAGLLLADSPSCYRAILLAVAIWGCCRAYYFAFYLIQHDIDPTYRFAGLTSFVGYVLRRQQ